MEKKTWNQLLELIDFALADGTAPEIETEEVWENIYRLSQFHKIQSLIFHAVQKLPKEQRPPESILKKFNRQEVWKLQEIRCKKQRKWNC